MNAPMDKADRLRRSAPGGGNVHQMPNAQVGIQRKPVFQVLEDSAVSYASAEEREIQRPITRTQVYQSPFAFSSLSDDILCDCQEFVPNSQPVNIPTTKVPLPAGYVTNTVLSLLPVDKAPLATLRQNRVRGAKSLPQFILQRVTKRVYVGWQENPKSAPGKIGYYVVETLECGHKQPVFPIEGEFFIARRRSCHECLQSFVKAVELKKFPEKARSPRKKMAGHSYWPIAFAAVILTGWAIWFKYHRPIIYTYGPPDTFRVLRQIDKYSFVMQRVEVLPMVPVTMHFCHDYAPRFEQGFTLLWLAYEDRGSCYSVGSPDTGYVIQRDKAGLPTVPSNCTNSADKPVVCNGEPRF